MLKLEAKGMEEVLKKVHTLGKIETLEMIAEMVESGMVSNMENVRAMARAIRTSCKEQKKELGLEDIGDVLSDNPNISKSDLDEMIKGIKNL